MAIRLDDLDILRHYSVWLNGEEVTQICDEAIGGNPGLAVLIMLSPDGKSYRCPCDVNLKVPNRGVLAYAVSGDVRIEIQQEAMR